MFQGFPGNNEPQKGKTSPAQALKMAFRLVQRERPPYKRGFLGVFEGFGA